METVDILIIVLLSIALTMIVTAYLTLVIAGYVERKIIRKYLGEDDEYDDESESMNGTKTKDRKGDKENFLRYKCKRKQGGWLLSLSPSVADSKTDKNPKVLKKELPVTRQERGARLLEKSRETSMATQERLGKAEHGKQEKEQ